ncbi:hypothetical protein [Streptomyces sp. NBC_00083]|uniref:hypothetical protein n=1 Tax=Streptomyces sp. NBC_00083 TaxID=2975647 RepID=UPI00225680EA|nr:hypothetical protein [Streptomyces sp. NBC_00083]MCX5387874.1 hypothetical protein [Streptomyces sp. NBC_00083]
MAPSEDKGASQSSPWPFNVLEVAQAAAGDVVTELSSFTTFQKRVDELIRNLKGSPAAPGEVGQERLARDQFGGGAGAFTEASGLFTSYETVITELETLSGLLSDSIEGMGIAVLASHKGYQNIDADVRKRMAMISTETKKHYGGDYDPASTHPKSDPKPSRGRAGGDL